MDDIVPLQCADCGQDMPDDSEHIYCEECMPLTEDGE